MYLDVSKTQNGKQTVILEDIVQLPMKIGKTRKWKDFAMDVYELYTIASQLRDDLIIIFCAHTESFQENGETFYRTKHGGQKATKLNLNSRLAYNLYTDVTVNSSNEREYWFVTQTDGHTEARSVEGVLPYRMPNDLGTVVRLIQEKDLGIQV